MNNKRLIIWDLDDTLIETCVEYDKTNVIAANLISNSIFGDESQVDVILNRQRQIDLNMISIYGFVPVRYIIGWVETYKEFVGIHSQLVKDEMIETLKKTIQNLYERKFKDITGSHEVLETLHGQGYTMIVLTAGVPEIQRKRIEDADILPYMQGVHVYAYKTPDTLREVLAQYTGFTAHMIGNSLKSDIHPALSNGIWGIHVVRETWEADQYAIDEANPLYHKIHDLRELPALLRELHAEPRQVG